jgi:hypothetical protein
MRKETAKQADFACVLLGLLLSMMMVAPIWGADPAQGKQVLIDPDFTLPLVDGNPPGWFRAMMPHLTIGLEAGVGRDEVGPYLFLKQEGVQGQLFNNWAQRLEGPPIGAKVRLETQVAVRNAQGKGAVVLVMFFDKAGKIVGGASSEEQYDLTGTKGWTAVRLEATVPPDSNLAIMRLGLSPAAGEIQVRYARLYVAGGAQGAPTAAVSAPGMQEGQAGLELLVNGNFEGPVILDSPVGWFRAMLPDRTVNLSAGLESVPGHGNVAFIRQEGVRAQIVNNWAQRLDVVPVGARLRLTADVKTRDMPENTGVIMIQCWDEAGELLAAATTQSDQPLGGTQDWRTISLEITVPLRTSTIIVRCGLSQSGTIWFDNVSLKLISPAVAQPADTTRLPARGFEVTDESLKQLQRVQTISEGLVAYVQRELGTNVRIRQEVFAQGGGRFQVVLSLDLSEPR